MPLAIQKIHDTIGEFQRNYLYYIFIERVPDAVREKFPEADAFQKEVDIYNKSAIFPNRKTDAIDIKYCGEFIKIPGVDSSTREGDFEFHDDEDMWCYKFFSYCKDLTGNEENQAGVKGTLGMFDIGVAKVSVNKKTITAYRRLENVRVYGVEAGELKKDGNEANTVKVSLYWDRNKDVPPEERQKEV